jgi:hypothetical protein
MAILKVFKSHIPSVNYIFKNGKPAIFVSGKFATGIQSEIDELEAEIAAGHPHIYVDAAEKEIDSEKVDPMIGLREKIIAEYLEKQAAAAGDPTRDMGTSAAGPIIPSSSADIASAALGGSGATSAGKLVNLMAGLAKK